ncbi:hypothetical protein HDU76_010773, partial [Blyttiomyces sp. JEL0837]
MVNALPALHPRENAVVNKTRHLSNPYCAVCSYSNNIEHKFYAIAYAENGTLIESLEEFMDIAGHGWHHRLCCDFDDPQDIHNVTNHFGQVRQVRLSNGKPVVQERANINLNVNFDTNQVKRRAASTVPLTDFIQQPPTCLPLLSSHPLFSPYNDILTPSGSSTRTLLAFPYYVNKSVTCPGSDVTTQPCTVQLTDTITTTTSLSYSVSDGNSNSYTNSIGTTSTVGSTTEAMQSVSDTLEKSNTFTHTSSQGGSQSQTWSEAITKTSETQTNWQKTHTDDSQDTLNIGHDDNHQKSHSTDDGTTSQDSSGWSASVGDSETIGLEENFGIASASESATITTNAGTEGSHTDGSSHSVTDGHSDGSSDMWNLAHQSGSSDSSSQGGSQSDSISDAVTNSKTSESNWQTSDSYASGNSQSHTVGSSNTYGASKSLSNDLQQTYQSARSIDLNQGTTNDTSLSFSVSIAAQIAPGVTVDVVYLTQSTFTAIPWVCKTNGQNTIITTDMADLSKTKSNSKSLVLLAPNQPPNYYQFDDNYLTTATVTNSLVSDTSILVNQQTTSGSDITGGKLMIMTTTNYEVWLTGFGSMYVKKKDVNGRVGAVLWNTHTNVQRSTDNIVNGVIYNGGSSRLLIDDMGHILIQVDHMFDKIGVSPYNYTYYDVNTRQNVVDTFITVWSNVPKNMMFPIGIKKAGYTFVLEEFPSTTGSNWNLILYDGGGSKVWCATAVNCNWAGSTGYRFPRNYLLPTDFPTNTVDPFQDGPSYPHNYLNPNYRLSVVNPAVQISENQKCGPILSSGQGLTSPNGRFKLILDYSGNIVFKDGIRTMWETYTANVSFAVPPYTLQLSNRGSLYVTDKYGGLIVNSLVNVDQVRNSWLNITDQGELQIHGTDGRQIWTSFDQINPGMSGWRAWGDRKTYCYPGCRTCLPKQPPSISVLSSNGSDNTPWTAYLKAGQTLLPTTGNVSLTVTNSSVTLGSCDLWKIAHPERVVKGGMILTISGSGRLSYVDANATQATWQVGTFFTGIEPFTVTVEDGILLIRDSFGMITNRQQCNCLADNGFTPGMNVSGCPFKHPNKTVQALPSPIHLAPQADVTYSLEMDGWNGAPNADAYMYQFSIFDSFVPTYLSNNVTFTLKRPNTNDCLGVDLDFNNVVKKQCATTSGFGTVWWNYISPSNETFYVNVDATRNFGPRGMCLSAPILGNYQQAIVEPCNITKIEQKWVNFNSPDAFNNMWYVSNGKCMTAVSKNGNFSIELHTCNNTDQQDWAYNFYNDGTFRPRFNPRLCLDVNGGLHGLSPLTLNPCNSTSQQQSWTYDSLWSTFANSAKPEYGITDSGFDGKEGNSLILYRLNQTANFAWQFSGLYVPMNLNNGWNYIFDYVKNHLAIEVTTVGPVASVNVSTWISGSDQQQFTNDNGLFRWKANPTMCLNAGGSFPGATGFTKVFLDSCLNRYGSTHSLQWNVGGQFIRSSSGCLTDLNGKHLDGDAVVAGTCDYTKTCSWTWSPRQPSYDNSELDATGFNTLHPGDRLTSPKGKASFYFDAYDGTIWLENNGAFAYLVQGTWKGSPHPFKLVLQTDGNFILFDAKNVQLWSTSTVFKKEGNYKAVLGEDAVLTFYALDKSVYKT